MQRFFLFCFFFICIASCTGIRDLSNTNLSSLYKNDEQLFHPEFSVYHGAADSSTLFVKINADEFLYVRQSDSRFRAYFQFHYTLIESFETPIVLDSSSRVIELSKEDSIKIKVISFHFKIPKQGKHLLICNIIDMNKNTDDHYYVNVDNSSKQSRQSFLVSLKGSTLPLFKNYISDKDSVHINYSDASVKNIFVRYYHRDFPLAPAPFSFDIHEEFDYKPDSTFTIDATDTSSRAYTQEGFYYFQTDTSDKEGMTLFRYCNGFPGVSSPDQMKDAVRYVCSKKEFDELNEVKNRKVAMDKFWLDIGGSAERTRQLIKKYYTRIQEANRFFSSHTEGWRTDRGMIYTIFGRPNNVYKSSNSETWFYGQPNNILSLSFFFVRVENPFTDNDYTLTRSPTYEGNWYRAVDVWRSGRVYNDL